jgi:hypothetical protein
VARRDSLLGFAAAQISGKRSAFDPEREVARHLRKMASEFQHEAAKPDGGKLPISATTSTTGPLCRAVQKTRAHAFALC